MLKCKSTLVIKRLNENLQTFIATYLMCSFSIPFSLFHFSSDYFMLCINEIFSFAHLFNQKSDLVIYGQFDTNKMITMVVHNCC